MSIMKKIKFIYAGRFLNGKKILYRYFELKANEQLSGSPESFLFKSKIDGGAIGTMYEAEQDGSSFKNINRIGRTTNEALEKTLTMQSETQEQLIADKRAYEKKAPSFIDSIAKQFIDNGYLDLNINERDAIITKLKQKLTNELIKQVKSDMKK
jgi:hypothetical protein